MQASDNAPDLKYLLLLSEKFPTAQSAFTEIINLEAILNLPKGTEHFMSDLHGEHEAFLHILNNCSGVIREWTNKVLGDELCPSQRRNLCTLIYYPRETLRLLERKGVLSVAWYEEALMDLIRIARKLSGQYTRSKVRKAMPVSYAYIIDELLHASAQGETSRHEYHVQIIKSIIETGAADDFIHSLSGLIKRLAVDHLHIIGDIFDRGQHADRIMDSLMSHHSLDIQWGNHDICWMGAASGSEACVASIVRTNVRGKTLQILENSYGISLRDLALFAQETYTSPDSLANLEQAITVILFKLEGQLIQRNPAFNLGSRLLLEELDLSAGTVTTGGKAYQLSTVDFPTVNPRVPYDLTLDERRVLDGLVSAFRDSERLRKHVSFLYEHGSLYLTNNGNLLIHGCIPLEADGTFSTMLCEGYPYSGKRYLDFCDQVARRAWNAGDQSALDWMYYLWCGPHSPLSGRVVKTFERSFVADASTWEEPQDPYYRATGSERVCREILEEFGLLDERCRIINGHTPVRVSSGESPIKANGKLLVIDGGFCEAYHRKTGIAGYTLISDARGMRIKAHGPFRGVEAALKDNADIPSDTTVIQREPKTLRIKDTDTGVVLREQIYDLRQLLDAYRSGLIIEKG